jgi:hypothetical protein
MLDSFIINFFIFKVLAIVNANWLGASLWV